MSEVIAVLKFPPANTDDLLRAAWQSFTAHAQFSLDALDQFAWPSVWNELLSQHGATEVWNAGLAALGYPPTWSDCEDPAEIQETIRKVLKELKKRNA